MNIWESTVLTDKGAALQAKLVDGQTLQITRVMTGAVKVPVVNLRQQTSVTDGGKEITLQPSRIEGDKMIVPVLLENKELEKGYDLWQVGIYAQDPDEGEILHCLAQASEAKHIPSVAEGPGFSITWDFCFKTSNTAPFEIHLNSVGLVSIEQYQVHTSEINNLKSSIVNLDERIEDLNSALSSLGTTIYPLKNSYGYGNFEQGYTTVGKIICVSSTVVLAANIAAGAALCSGLPIPVNYCAVLNIYDGQTGGFTHAKIVNGILYLGNAHNKSAALRITGSYIAS